MIVTRIDMSICTLTLISILIFSGCEDQSHHLIFTAIKQDNANAVIAFLNKDHSLINLKNSRGMSPLHVAMQFDSYESAKVLLGRGSSIYNRDIDGFSILYAACHSVISVELLDLSRDVIDTYNVDKYGNKMLHIACADENLDVVRFLLKKGANPQVLNDSNQTPLQFALSIKTTFSNEFKEAFGVSENAGQDKKDSNEPEKNKE